MRFLADENLEQPIIERLRERGYDVLAVASEFQGAVDTDVLAQALADERILITNDKDFAELTFLQRRASAGIVLVRLPNFRGDEKAERVLETVEEQRERLREVLTVIEADAIRRRPFLTVRKARDPAS